MSHEAQGHDPDEPPVPPASTRWSEEPLPDEDALAPPFVPGRPRTGFASPPTEEPAAEPAVEAAVEESAPGPVDEEAFPFDARHETEWEPEERPEEAEPKSADMPSEPASAARAAPAAEVSEAPEDEFPFDRFDIEGQDEPSTEPEDAAAAKDLGWSPADLDLEAVAEEEPQMSREPSDSTGGEVVAATPEEAPGAPSQAAETSLGGDAATEAAALLERLSSVLRTEGEAGVRREMESPDRMTAVLAGLLAGYVSGRS